MSKENIPFVDDIRTHLDETASAAVVEVVAGQRTERFELTLDMSMMLIRKLGQLNAIWEKRRRQIDPNAGNAGDVVAMTAIRAHSVDTASVPGTAEGAIIFHTAQGPQAFAIPKAAMAQIAQKLLREAERDPAPPPLSS